MLLRRRLVCDDDGFALDGLEVVVEEVVVGAAAELVFHCAFSSGKRGEQGGKKDVESASRGRAFLAEWEGREGKVGREKSTRLMASASA